MVGTNRSKGCKTCIRRKVRCGAEKPICFRCITARIPCEGYVRDFRWIDDKHSTSRRTSRDKSSSTSASSQSPQKGLIGPQTEIYVEFFKHKFLSEDLDHGTFSHMKWIEECFKTKADDAANLAVNALVLLFFARMNGNSQSVHAQSNKYYGKALRRLQVSIESPNSAQLSLTPAALALTYFELVAYHTEGGWLHHAGGIGRLMELSGPHRYQEYPEHGYFLLARPIVLITAMVLRQPTFLASSEWKTVPWEKYPETKTPSHEMMDLWADGPTMGRDIVAMLSTAPQTTNTVIMRLTGMIQSMVRWRWKWEEANSCAVTEREVDPLNSISVDHLGHPLFNTILWYENITQMIEIMYYNVVLITMTYCAACLRRPKLVEDIIAAIPGSNGREVTNALGFPGTDVPQTYGAPDVCRSIEYALHQKSGSINAWQLLLPLRMAVLTLAFQDFTGTYRTWIATVCDRLASDSGFALAQRIKYLPRLHPTRNLQEIPDGERYNVTGTTLPVMPVEQHLTPVNEPWNPTVGGSFSANVGPLMQDRIERHPARFDLPYDPPGHA